jgi:hypothetical protein
MAPITPANAEVPINPLKVVAIGDSYMAGNGLRVLVPTGVRPGFLPRAEALAAQVFDIAAIGPVPTGPGVESTDA